MDPRLAPNEACKRVAVALEYHSEWTTVVQKAGSESEDGKRAGFRLAQEKGACGRSSDTDSWSGRTEITV